MNEDVAYIIQDQERQSFRQLTTVQQREQFIEQFWLRRDPTPGTVINEMKEEHYRRIAHANEHFASSIPGWKTDRGRIYITYGPPDEIEAHPSGGSYRRPAEQGGGTIWTFPFEQWRYKWIEGVGRDVIIEFVDSTRTGEFRMTMDPAEKNVRQFVQLNQPPLPASRIYITGEVNRPGGYEFVVPTTVLQALVNAGGFRSTANTKTIVIQRGTIRLNFNYEEVFRGINPGQNVVLQPGDQIIVK
jgi:GWxTD domain-containing protein